MTTDPRDLASNANVSRETLERLEVYAATLQKWSSKINLVSATTLSDMWSRHFEDSAQLVKLIPEHSKTGADLGSGAGFPGMVLAILRPDITFHLIESDKRKASFLRTVAAKTSTDASIQCRRIEEIEPLSADVLCARALAPLSQLLGYAERHLAQTGTALFQKGNNHAKEVEAALEHWSFRCETHSSQSDTSGVVLSITEIARA